MSKAKVPPIIALNEIGQEYLRAAKKFPDFASAHEGYAVLLEEVDELWDAIKNNKTTTTDELRSEAIQVAAMALRFIMDVCPIMIEVTDDV